MHDRAIYTSDHELFRQNARCFFREELEPNIDQWEKPGSCLEILKAGISPLWGRGHGGPADFLYNMVLSEEVGAIGGAMSASRCPQIFALLFAPCGSEAQKQRWLPPLVSGEAIAAIGMTEPGCGAIPKQSKPLRCVMTITMSSMGKKHSSLTVRIAILCF